MQRFPGLDRIETFREQPSATTDLHAALEQAQHRYHELLDFLPDAHLRTDPRGVIQEASAGVSALVSFARRYVIGKPPTAHRKGAKKRKDCGVRVAVLAIYLTKTFAYLCVLCAFAVSVPAG